MKSWKKIENPVVGWQNKSRKKFLKQQWRGKKSELCDELKFFLFWSEMATWERLEKWNKIKENTHESLKIIQNKKKKDSTKKNKHSTKNKIIIRKIFSAKK